LKGTIEHLNTRINLVDTQSLDIILSKFQLISERLNQLNEKKALFDDNEKYRKVNDLYNKLIKWQEMFVMFPKLIERLSSLNELHQQAAQFSSTLSRLNGDNSSMKQKLDANIDFINQV
jgi:dynactin-2